MHKVCANPDDWYRSSDFRIISSLERRLRLILHCPPSAIAGPRAGNNGQSQVQQQQPCVRTHRLCDLAEQSASVSSVDRVLHVYVYGGMCRRFGLLRTLISRPDVAASSRLVAGTRYTATLCLPNCVLSVRGLPKRASTSAIVDARLYARGEKQRPRRLPRPSYRARPLRVASPRHPRRSTHGPY